MPHRVRQVGGALAGGHVVQQVREVQPLPAAEEAAEIVVVAAGRDLVVVAIAFETGREQLAAASAHAAGEQPVVEVQEGECVLASAAPDYGLVEGAEGVGQLTQRRPLGPRAGSLPADGAALDLVHRVFDEMPDGVERTCELVLAAFVHRPPRVAEQGADRDVGLVLAGVEAPCGGGGGEILAGLGEHSPAPPGPCLHGIPHGALVDFPPQRLPLLGPGGANRAPEQQPAQKQVGGERPCREEQDVRQPRQLAQERHPGRSEFRGEHRRARRSDGGDAASEGAFRPRSAKVFAFRAAVGAAPGANALHHEVGDRERERSDRRLRSEQSAEQISRLAGLRQPCDRRSREQRERREGGGYRKQPPSQRAGIGRGKHRSLWRRLDLPWPLLSGPPPAPLPRRRRRRPRPRRGCRGRVRR